MYCICFPFFLIRAIFQLCSNCVVWRLIQCKFQSQTKVVSTMAVQCFSSNQKKAFWSVQECNLELHCNSLIKKLHLFLELPNSPLQAMYNSWKRRVICIQKLYLHFLCSPRHLFEIKSRTLHRASISNQAYQHFFPVQCKYSVQSCLINVVSSQIHQSFETMVYFTIV